MVPCIYAKAPSLKQLEYENTLDDSKNDDDNINNSDIQNFSHAQKSLKIRKTAIDIQFRRRDLHYVNETISLIVKIFDSRTNINGISLEENYTSHWDPAKDDNNVITQHEQYKKSDEQKETQKADQSSEVQEEDPQKGVWIQNNKKLDILINDSIKSLELENTEDDDWYSRDLELWGECDGEVDWYEQAKICYYSHNLSDLQYIDCYEEDQKKKAAQRNSYCACVSFGFAGYLEALKNAVENLTKPSSTYSHLRRYNERRRRQSVHHLEELNDSGSRLTQFVFTIVSVFISKRKHHHVKHRVATIVVQLKSIMVIFAPVIGLFFAVLMIWICLTYFADVK